MTIEITSTLGYALCEACRERAAITIEMAPEAVGELVRAFVTAHPHRGVAIVTPGPAKATPCARCSRCNRRTTGRIRDAEGDIICSRCVKLPSREVAA